MQFRLRTKKAVGKAGLVLTARHRSGSKVLSSLFIILKNNTQSCCHSYHCTQHSQLTVQRSLRCCQRQWTWPWGHDWALTPGLPPRVRVLLHVSSRARVYVLCVAALTVYKQERACQSCSAGLVCFTGKCQCFFLGGGVCHTGLCEGGALGGRCVPLWALWAGLPFVVGQRDTVCSVCVCVHGGGGCW